MDWRVYYADGSTFDSDQGEYWDAPGLGVLVIVQKHRIRQERDFIQHREGYYIWTDGRWLACDLFRVWQYLFVNRTDFPKVVLAGETVRNQAYMDAVRAAKDDKDFQGVVG